MPEHDILCCRVNNSRASTRPTKPKKRKIPFQHIDQLQKQAARHAERLAIAVQITDCLQINLNGLGHGYWMDFPSDDRQLDVRQSAVWWHLFACSGLTAKEDHGEHELDAINRRTHALPTHNKLKSVLLNNPDYYSVFCEKVGDPNQFTLTLYYLTDPDVEERLHREFIGLSSTCRELLITANENGLTQELWTKK